MAKGRKSQPTVRRVKNAEDRKRPSVFMRLKTQEKFVAHAMFEPDPELDDNPGYFEYYDHWDNENQRHVPCAGEDCIFCKTGHNPSTRAATVWYLPKNDKGDQFKVFTLNFRLIEEFVDIAEEEEGILGHEFRVKRLSDMGDYRARDLGNALKAKEIAKILEDERFPQAADLVNAQLQREIEAQAALEALGDDDDDDTDDDDDEDEKPTKAKKGKEKEVDDEDDDDDEDDEDDDEAPEDIEDVEFELLSVSKKNNTAKVEHEDETIVLHGDDDNDLTAYKKGDEITLSAEWDEDDERWNVTDIEEEESEADDDDDGDGDEPEEGTEFKGTVEVISTDEKEETITAELGEYGESVLWIPEDMDIDLDEIPDGVKLKIEAMVDAEGDWVLTEEPEAKAAKGKGKKKSKK